MSAEMQKPPLPVEAERLILVFPAYAYQIPFMVLRFLRRSVIRASYIAALVTFGTDPGGSLAEVGRILRRRGTPVSFFYRIPSVENFIPIFGAQPDTMIAKRLELQAHATAEAVRAIQNGEVNRVWTLRPFSFFVSTLFRTGRPLFSKGYRVSGACNRCGLCVRLCPAGAIRLQESGPVFSAACEHCQGCLNWCPRGAINYLRLKPETKRYHHPDVQLTDMFRS
jgi:ferredoxin